MDRCCWIRVGLHSFRDQGATMQYDRRIALQVFAKQMFPSPIRREPCFKCQLPVFLAERLIIGRVLFHRTCFRCARCKTQLTLNSYYETEKGEYCCETCPDEELEESTKEQDSYSEDFELALGEEASTQAKQDPVISMPQQSSNDKARMAFLAQSVEAAEGKDDEEVTRTVCAQDIPAITSIARNSLTAEDMDPQQDGSVDLKDVSGTGETKTDQIESDTKVVQNVNSDIDYTPSNGNSSFVQDRITIFEESPKPLNIPLENTITAEEVVPHVAEDLKKLVVPIVYIDGVEQSVSDLPERTESADDNCTASLTATQNSDDSKSECKSMDDQIPSETSQEEPPRATEIGEYPDELNPFESDDAVETSLNPFASSSEDEYETSGGALGKKSSTLIDEPNSSSNPFWSDDERSSIENDSDSKPVPQPRRSVQPSGNANTSRSITPNHGEPPQPFPRHFLDASVDKSGSINSLTSIGSGTSRKKRPAPKPPQARESLPALPLLQSTPKPRLKKSRPAPQPPTKQGEVLPVKAPIPREKKLSPGKLEKELQNRTRQNQSDVTSPETPSSPSKDKSMYGQWKRKKGPAPPRPLPQKRQIRKLPLADIQRELKDIEVKQLELERQGVGIEKSIRVLCEGDNQTEDVLVPEAEEAILQLFELVNEKNELFRRETELMYLKREQRLEEEHAELEYQIRCLMDKSEGQKTVEDQIREEELIQRLIHVVEQRNEVVECLELERRREVEEDRSIQFSLYEAHQRNSERESKVKHHKLNPFRLGKKDKKKKEKKKKKLFDADKDIDESENSAAAAQTSHGKEGKAKKKWL